MVKFRKLSGKEGVEELLARIIEVVVTLKLITKKELVRIIVDSTVQEKATAYPTGSNLYSWEATEVECISKGKSRKPCKFGVNVGIATTLKGTLIVGARSFPGKPYDGYTLNEQVEQLSILMQASGMTPQTAIVDLGYRSVGKENQNLDLKYRSHLNSIMVQERKLLKRGKVIVPIKGNLKQAT